MLQYTLRRVTAPTVEPVTVAEAKEVADIDGSDADALVQVLIKAAREHVEDETGLALVTQTWRMTLNCWPFERRDQWFDGVRELPVTELEAETVLIPKAPFQSIDAVNTIDESGTATEWAASNYYAVIEQDYGRLCRKAGHVWPTTSRDFGGIEIDFLCGFGALATDVPDDLRLAVKMIVKHWYDHPDMMACKGSSGQVPANAQALLKRRKVRKL